jgi:ribosomal protein L29
MPTPLLAESLRRFGTAFISKRLVKDIESDTEKKHPERKKKISTIITQSKALKKQQFEKKFPTKAQRVANKKRKKEFKKNIKDLKQREVELYETDPKYRVTTSPRNRWSDTRLAIVWTNPMFPGMRTALRKSAKESPTYIGKRASFGALKMLDRGVESIRNFPKNFTPKGRKWLKKREKEDARARSILSGDV